MGTSLDLVVAAESRAQAERVESTVLDEIARLSGLLSTYNENSEASRWNRAPGSFRISPELFEILRLYDVWGQRTYGALTSRASEGNLNIDALGKAWILDRALAVARRTSPAVMIDIGGDIAVSSDSGRRVTVDLADPFRSWENAEPLTRIGISGGAVATSGTSMRGAHITDPRTGRPARDVVSATVIAGDSVTANALSTAACVLGPHEGVHLIGRTPGAEGLIAAADGTTVRSSGFAAFESPVIVRAQGESKWPNGWEVTMTVPLTAYGGHRPYLAVWAEDMSGHLVKNIALFANKPRYLNDLRAWYSANYNNGANWRSVARPTRGPGSYSFGWNGRDERGNAAPQGSYRISVECAVEHGQYYRQSAVIACAGKPASATLKRTGYFDDVSIQYGPGNSRA